MLFSPGNLLLIRVAATPLPTGIGAIAAANTVHAGERSAEILGHSPGKWKPDGANNQRKQHRRGQEWPSVA